MAYLPSLQTQLCDLHCLRFWNGLQKYTAKYIYIYAVLDVLLLLAKVCNFCYGRLGEDNDMAGTTNIAILLTILLLFLIVACH